MSFDDVMAVLSRWLTATEALAATGAEVAIAANGDRADPAVRGALRAVTAAAGLPDLGELAMPQRDLVTGLIRMCLRQAQDLLDEPGRPPGWTFTDPDILRGWGRASMPVPAALAAAVPELAGVRSFLDVGTGIGLLAIAAAATWPSAQVTGIDIWPPALAAAAATISQAGLAGRVTIRAQDVADLDDEQAYDCAWLPTFFVTEPVLDAAMPRLVRSLRPGGWLALGRLAAPPDALAEATTALRVIRGGGAEFDVPRLAAALDRAGCRDVRVLPRRGPAPLEYVLGQRPPG